MDFNRVTPSRQILLNRAKFLNDPDTNNIKPSRRKSIPMEKINCEDLEKRSILKPPPPPPTCNDFEVHCTYIYSILYDLSSESIIKQERHWDTSINRWRRLLNSGDAKSVWEDNIREPIEMEPTENEFKKHFENLLNPANHIPLESNYDDCPYIPILDDAISVGEVKESIKETNPNIAADINGIPPGIFRHLSISWIITLTFIFNVAFNLLLLPLSWASLKFIVIFKK